MANLDPQTWVLFIKRSCSKMLLQIFYLIKPVYSHALSFYSSIYKVSNPTQSCENWHEVFLAIYCTIALGINEQVYNLTLAK
jgi:hypothetical protein